MAINLTIPSPGESITEVVLGPWHKASGEWVEKDETLVEIESDKVTLELPAPESGVLRVVAEEGAELPVGTVIGSIDPDAQRPEAASPNDEPAPASPAARAEAPPASGDGAARVTPMARKLAAEMGLDLTTIQGTGPSGRITKADVLAASDASGAPPASVTAPPPAHRPTATRGVRRERLSKLRRRIAERLVEAQQTAATLTTFNEADMSQVMALRAEHKEAFAERHGVGLGFMSFFVTACVSALRTYPRINAYIAGDEVEFHDYVDVSIAVGTEKGLVVPVVRNAEMMSFADIERAISDLAARAREGRLSLDDMTGGTFTISNGGVYGSLLSTPILNPPQSGILGLHKIIKRPVEDPGNPGQIALRPMMNLALSYDHRIVDGEQAVKFLVHVKEQIEDPSRMMLGI